MINIKTHREFFKDLSKERHFCLFCYDAKIAHYWSQADIEGKPISVSLWHCQAHRWEARQTLFRDHNYKTLADCHCSCMGIAECTCARSV
jgi:hypothetical protein